MNITLHIERLILENLPITSHDGAAVQRAIERELGHRFAGGAINPALHGVVVPHLSTHSIALSRNVKPARVAADIAQVIHTRLSSLSSFRLQSSVIFGSPPMSSNMQREQIDSAKKK